jgi:ABC-type nitrate/sulfonate/bicarbonate transport system permease component
VSIRATISDPDLLGGETRDARQARIVLRLGGVLVFLAVCEAVCRIAISPHDVPPPSEMIGTLAGQLGHSSFWASMLHTLQGWGIGLGISIGIGIPLGLAIGTSEILWRAVRPAVEMLRAVPSLALVPLTVLLWGNGIKGNVILTALTAVWPITIQTIYGVHEIDTTARDTVRSYGLGLFRRVRYLTIPSALPFIATGIRIGSSIGMLVTITSELVIGTPGLGDSLVLAENGGDIKLMYAFILAAGILGSCIYMAFMAVETRLLSWRVVSDAGGAT